MLLQVTTAALHVLTALFNTWSGCEKLMLPGALTVFLSERLMHVLNNSRCRDNKDVYLLHAFVMSHCFTASVDTRNYL